MDIIFTGHNLEITDALRDITNKKFHKLERYFNALTNVHVTFKVEKIIHNIEVSMQFAKNHIQAHAATDDLYDAIDEVVDKLYHQLEKIKDKMHDHHRGHP